MVEWFGYLRSDCCLSRKLYGLIGQHSHYVVPTLLYVTKRFTKKIFNTYDTTRVKTKPKMKT